MISVNIRSAFAAYAINHSLVDNYICLDIMLIMDAAVLNLDDVLHDKIEEILWLVT